MPPPYPTQAFDKNQDQPAASSPHYGDVQTAAALFAAEPALDIGTMEKVISDSVADRRFQMTLLAIFATVALILAATGVYSVMATAVARRTREMGIRLALGAPPSAVLRLVVGQGMELALAGVGIGLAAAFDLTRLMKGLLFGVTAAIC